MFKNIIFDFGQVLVHFDPHYMTSVYIRNEEDVKTVYEVVFDRLYWDRLDAGTISDQEVKAGICSRLPLRLHQGALKAYDNWIYNIPFIEGMKELLCELKERGAKLFLLSNISKGFAEKYPSVPEIGRVLSLFDGLVLSGPIGITKPDRKIFEYLLSKYSLNAEDCIFIDDSPKNIAGAENAGIKGYLFDGDAKKLRRELLK